MPVALVSVSDKTGLEEFCTGLVERGWEIVSTSGTRNVLLEAGFEVKEIGELTGHPEMLAGRVKTLHPTVHAGILARRTVQDDLEELAKYEISPIGLVAVNLYPFQRTISREFVTLADALEQIDIGGPTLLRAAAKNHPFVWSICDPEDYGRVLTALDENPGEERSQKFRRKLAAKVFRHTASYDATIGGYLDFAEPVEFSEGKETDDVMTSLTRVQTLRYGENPDQAAAFFRDGASPPWGIPSLKQLHGKELSFTNILDIDGALLAIAPFTGADTSACAIIKHTTSCGVAVGRTPLIAYEKALACDPVSAFGSVVAFTEPVTEAVADALSQNFVECVVAPGYAGTAIEILQRKKNLRILQPANPVTDEKTGGHLWPGIEVRGVRGGLLFQTNAEPVAPLDRTVNAVTARAPTEVEWEDLSFAWAAIQSVKSNAILLARNKGSIGIGAGQMSRVDSVGLAIRKAEDQGLDVSGAVLASDAFFPFRDGIDAAAAVGVTAIVQPGGSVRDEEVVAAANEHDITMVFTQRRLFRH
jgi:phosphoribosylaminoimidazolecarboxamide formyltransferase/IMP cyclohydrolase